MSNIIKQKSSLGPTNGRQTVGDGASLPFDTDASVLAVCHLQGTDDMYYYSTTFSGGPGPKCPPDRGSSDCVTGSPAPIFSNSNDFLSSPEFQHSLLNKHDKSHFADSNNIRNSFNYPHPVVVPRAIPTRSASELSTPPLTPDDGDDSDFGSLGSKLSSASISKAQEKDALDYLLTLFPRQGLQALPYAKNVSISAPNLGAAFDGVVLELPGKPKTLYVDGKSAESVSFRESIVALLDLADERLECSALVIVLERSSPNLAALLHSLMYVGGTVVTKPPFEMSSGIRRTVNTILQALFAAVGRLDKSLSPAVTLNRLREHHFNAKDIIHVFHLANASFWLFLMRAPGFPSKLVIPTLWSLALLIPLTSQFFLPATPIFTWLITYYSSRFIPTSWRPNISVSLLPTLESVLYGANISDILTRFTHPILDIIAWLPYGVGHFSLPFFVAAFLWLFRSKESLHLWARTFGYLNFTGVAIQIFFPCAAPWYEVIHGLTPANYSMKGSPGGLARIDALLGGSTYTVGFSNAPVVFGAFPSLHAACATIEALFMSHFFPQTTRYVWTYTAVLYWATMYLTHHYLIDVVSGACLAVAFFYLFLPDSLRGEAALALPSGLGTQRTKYEVYDLEDPSNVAAFELSDVSSDEEMDIAYRSPNTTTTFPTFSVPILKQDAGKKSHRHTASIASLIRGEERSAEDGWSPVSATFTVPPARGER
ncbi:hypothetical protein H0H93_008626 [Arthromyces matolae]|nr:hypothetical protein H0H93_008626 [Arthromyces matolae]